VWRSTKGEKPSPGESRRRSGDGRPVAVALELLMSDNQGTRKLAVEPLTRELFAPFGALIAPESKDSPNLNRAPGNLSMLWVQKELEFPDRSYMCTLRYYYRGNRCEFIQKHPASTVTLITLGSASSVIIVVPDNGNDQPVVERARAFLLEGAKGVVVNRGVWVRYAYPVGAFADFAYVTQRVDPTTANTTDDVVRMNLANELGFVFEFELAPPQGSEYSQDPSGAVTSGPERYPPWG